MIIFINFTVNFFGGIKYSLSKENDYFYHSISGILNKYDDSTLVITNDRLVLMDYLTRYKVNNMVSIQLNYLNSKDYNRIKSTLDSTIKNNRFKQILTTSDIFNYKNINENNKEFLNNYFNDNNFDIIKFNPNQINEYYQIKIKNK